MEVQSQVETVQNVVAVVNAVLFNYACMASKSRGGWMWSCMLSISAHGKMLEENGLFKEMKRPKGRKDVPGVIHLHMAGFHLLLFASTSF